jgi:hypothetical protein
MLAVDRSTDIVIGSYAGRVAGVDPSSYCDWFTTRCPPVTATVSEADVARVGRLAVAATDVENSPHPPLAFINSRRFMVW